MSDTTSIPITVKYIGHNKLLDRDICRAMATLDYEFVASGYNLNTKERDIKFDVADDVPASH